MGTTWTGCLSTYRSGKRKQGGLLVPMQTSMQEKIVPFCATFHPRQPLCHKGLQRLANSGCVTPDQTGFRRKHEKTAGSKCFQRFTCAPQVGLEPTTLRLTAECSAIELLRNVESGGDLLSRAVTSQVLSALKGLTSVFGMGTGGTPSSLPPEMVLSLLPFAASLHFPLYVAAGRSLFERTLTTAQSLLRRSFV